MSSCWQAAGPGCIFADSAAPSSLSLCTAKAILSPRTEMRSNSVLAAPWRALRIKLPKVGASKERASEGGEIAKERREDGNFLSSNVLARARPPFGQSETNIRSCMVGGLSLSWRMLMECFQIKHCERRGRERASEGRERGDKDCVRTIRRTRQGWFLAAKGAARQEARSVGRKEGT